MVEQIITFETAKLAKEKGLWQEIGFSKYDSKGSLWHIFETCPEKSNLTCIAATQSLLQKWLREKHGIYVILSVAPLSNIIDFYYSIRYGKNIGKFKSGEDPYTHKNYEEALEKGLQEALKLIN